MPKGYTHLTPDDRCQIEVPLRRGDSIGAIGLCGDWCATCWKSSLVIRKGLFGSGPPLDSAAEAAECPAVASLLRNPLGTPADGTA